MNAKQDWAAVEPSELMVVEGGSGNVAQAAANAILEMRFQRLGSGIDNIDTAAVGTALVKASEGSPK